jgi:hypothetical protein
VKEPYARPVSETLNVAHSGFEQPHLHILPLTYSLDAKMACMYTPKHHARRMNETLERRSLRSEQRHLAYHLHPCRKDGVHVHTENPTQMLVGCDSSV